MLNWRHSQKSDALEQARARARQREEEQGAGHCRPSGDGMVVEEISPEEFMRLFQQVGKPD